MDEITIDRYQTNLAQAGAAHVERYIRKLRDNAGCPQVLQDLAFEGDVALTFLTNGFTVSMRESPDLEVGFAGNRFFVEVKHFREKAQDVIDDARMRAAGDLLVRYGDTVAIEGVPAYEQVVAVAKHKANQFRQGAPNVLAIRSSSYHCIEDLEVLTARDIIEQELAQGTSVHLRRLSGMLLIGSYYVKGRNVFFFPLRTAERPLTREALAAIQGIRSG